MEYVQWALTFAAGLGLGYALSGRSDTAKRKAADQAAGFILNDVDRLREPTLPADERVQALARVEQRAYQISRLVGGGGYGKRGAQQ